MAKLHYLPKLNYLNKVLKEAFRLHPALPLLVPRTPQVSYVLRGYMIPKGSNMFLNVGYIHRDPKIWDEPSEFRLEKFLEDPSRYDLSGSDFTYMPFSFGHRICAGLVLAERMLTFVFASLLHSFTWDFLLGTELDVLNQFGIVVKKTKPLVAIPRLRLST